MRYISNKDVNGVGLSSLVSFVGGVIATVSITRKSGLNELVKEQDWGASHALQKGPSGLCFLS